MFSIHAIGLVDGAKREVTGIGQDLGHLDLTVSQSFVAVEGDAGHQNEEAAVRGAAHRPADHADLGTVVDDIQGGVTFTQGLVEVAGIVAGVIRRCFRSFMAARTATGMASGGRSASPVGSASMVRRSTGRDGRGR